MNNEKDTRILHLANDVRDIQYRVHCASELVRLIHTALTEGPNEAGENDFDALFGAYWLLRLIDSEFNGTAAELENAACQLIRERGHMEGNK